MVYELLAAVFDNAAGVGVCSAAAA